MREVEAELDGQTQGPRNTAITDPLSLALRMMETKREQHKREREEHKVEREEYNKQIGKLENMIKALTNLQQGSPSWGMSFESENQSSCFRTSQQS